jgi:hypothetical protein
MGTGHGPAIAAHYFDVQIGLIVRDNHCSRIHVLAGHQHDFLVIASFFFAYASVFFAVVVAVIVAVVVAIVVAVVIAVVIAVVVAVVIAVVVAVVVAVAVVIAIVVAITWISLTGVAILFAFLFAFSFARVWFLFAGLAIGHKAFGLGIPVPGIITAQRQQSCAQRKYCNYSQMLFHLIAPSVSFLNSTFKVAAVSLYVVVTMRR